MLRAFNGDHRVEQLVGQPPLPRGTRRSTRRRPFSPPINRAPARVYKLLALGSNSQGNFLYATDFHNNKIDVFDKHFQKVPLGANGFDTFTDPNEPAGFAPFGIKDINGTLFVSYAKQLGPDNTDDQEGPGNGFIDTFDTSGHFLGRFASGTAAGGTLTQLNSPIGIGSTRKTTARFTHRNGRAAQKRAHFFRRHTKSSASRR